MVEKFFLALAVFTTLIVIYFGFGTEPDVYLWSWFGLKYGINLQGNIYWRIASVASWVLYIMAKEIKDDGDYNSGIGGTN